MQETEIKLAIVGCRPKTKLVKYEFVKEQINLLMAKHDLKPILIIHGGAQGIDSHAHNYAIEYGIKELIHLPDYENNPPYLAPLIRNEFIARDCDIMIAFWDEKSKGTKNAIEWAGKYDKDLIIVKI